MSYTPGPWYEASTGNHQGLVSSENDGINIAAVYEKKNARLIAAAPELLEALKGLVEFEEAGCPDTIANEWGDVIEFAKAAIAKATD